MNLNRLTRAIRDAILLLIVVLAVGLGFSLGMYAIINTESGKIAIMCLPPFVFFCILVKVCYDYEVDK